ERRLTAALVLAGGGPWRGPSPTPSARHHPEERRRQPRVERVTDAVSEEVEGEHGDRDGQPGEEDQPPMRHQRRQRLGQHIAPGRRRRRDADAEEPEGGLDDDGDAEVGGGQHEVRRQALRQDVAHHHPERRAAGGARAPWTTRLSVSRPTWSVPKRLCVSGGFAMRRKLVLSGSDGAMTGAVSAMTPMSRPTRPPAMASGLRRANDPSSRATERPG